jgi:hypothetical protein
MTTKTDPAKQLNDIRKKLSLLGCKESSFITVELLFYESLTISRVYGDDPSGNELLAALKNLERNQYKDAKELFRKSTQKELAIRRFMVQLKIVLAWGSKKFPSSANKEKTTARPV